MTRRVLVTGGTGLIGAELVRCFQSDPELGALELLVWNRVNHGSLLDDDRVRRTLEDLRPQVVVHLAWRSTGVPGYEAAPENRTWAEATLNLAQQAAPYCDHFVACGTGIERNPDEEETPYLNAKRRAFEAIRGALDSEQWTWIRPFWVFSRTHGRPRVVRECQRVARTGGSAPLINHPCRRLDFVELNDVACAVAAVVANGLPGEVDIGSGKGRSVIELLRGLQLPFAVAPPVPVSGHSAVHVESDPPVADVGPLLAVGWRPWQTNVVFGVGGTAS